jgi:Spy/CpxP family protein refolding chaperone
MLLIGGGLISLSTPGFTQPLGPPTGLPPENLFATLGLDEDTQAEIRTIKTTSRAELRKLLPQLQQAHQRMNALLDQDTPEEATVMEQIETMATIQMKIKQERLRTMLRVRTLLSPAQRTALRKKMRTRPRFGHPGRRRGGARSVSTEGFRQPEIPEIPKIPEFIEIEKHLCQAAFALSDHTPTSPISVQVPLVTQNALLRV